MNAKDVMDKIGHGNLWFHSVRSHMFLKEKYDAAGNFEKIKARLMADGSTQARSDFDEEDIASPTASLESIFNMLKLVAMENRHLLILDIGGAYLNAEIDRTVYMFIEPELVNIMVNINSGYAKYRDVKGRILTQVDKAMYGLVQSAKLWYETITGVLKDNGYAAPNPTDPCVWNKVVGGDQITIVIYVDDLAISCRNKVEVHKATDMVKSKFIDIKVKESNEMSYLGMNLKIDNDGIQLSMESYIQDMIMGFGENCGSILTLPMISFLLTMVRCLRRIKSSFIRWWQSCYTSASVGVLMWHCQFITSALGYRIQLMLTTRSWRGSWDTSRGL